MERIANSSPCSRHAKDEEERNMLKGRKFGAHTRLVNISVRARKEEHESIVTSFNVVQMRLSKKTYNS